MEQDLEQEKQRQEILQKNKEEVFASIKSLSEKSDIEEIKRAKGYKIDEEGFEITIFESEGDFTATISPKENFDINRFINENERRVLPEKDKKLIKAAETAFKKCIFEIDMDRREIQIRERDEASRFDLSNNDANNLQAELPVKEDTKNPGLIVLSHALKEIADRERNNINFRSSGRVEEEPTKSDELTFGQL